MNKALINFRNLFLQYKNYFKSSFLYLFSSIFTAALTILINPLMAKNLLPEDYAILGYFTSFTIFILPIINFSLITYYLRTYYRISEEKRQKLSDTILIALLIYGFFALIVVTGLYYIYWKLAKISFSFYPYAILTFAPVYLNNFLILFQAKCRIKGEAWKYAKITILSILFNTILSVLLVVFFKYGATGKLVAALISSFVIAFIVFKKIFEKIRFDRSTMKDAIQFGWPISISAILWYFLSGVDRAMLEKLNDNYTFGFYNVAFQIAGFLGVFHTAIAQTFEPDINKAIVENKKKKLAKIIGGIVSLNAIPNILFIFLAPYIIGFLTYNRYTDSSHFAQIFALKNIALSIYYCSVAILIGYGYTKSQLVILIVGSVLSIFIYKICINFYAFYGAAWAQVLSLVSLIFIIIVFLFFKFKHTQRIK